MAGILLIIDELNELSYLQKQLKKSGLVVKGTPHHHRMEALLKDVAPQVVIVKTSQVSGMELSSKIQKNKGLPKVIFLNEKGPQVDSGIKGIDRVLTSPVKVEELLGVISQWGELSPETLLEDSLAVEKARGRDRDFIVIRGEKTNPTEMVVIKGEKVEKESGAFSQGSKGRSSRYQLFLAGQKPLEKKHFSRGSVASLTREIRDRWDEELEAKLKKERQKFIEILFNSKGEGKD